MEQFCDKVHINDTITQELKNVKETFTTIQVISCFFGVLGNIFNIQTLQSPTLQTVPFMYIRSLAYFDLIALSMILCHYTLGRFPTTTPIMFYTTYIEAPIINTFLIAGLYCAFFLTLERYLKIRYTVKSQEKPNHRARARGKILMMLTLSFVIHLPMVLQRTMKMEENGEYVMVNNVELLCKEPHWSVYSYYKLSRECLRFLIVILMTIFNVIIALQLQDHKKRRDRLGRRSSPQNELPNNIISSDSESTVNSLSLFKREDTMLIKSFTERKLTVLMIVICIIFLLGNIPQIIVMILQNESMENNYKFQLYRHCSNTLEVLNHCLNFYVFCIASSEYTRCFLHNYKCLQNFLYRFPKVARFLSSRRSSVMVSAGGFGMANKEYMSMDSIPEEARQWVVDPSSSPYAQADANIKGILVTGNRETRQKKSLTIVNHRAVDIEADSDHEVTSI